MELPAQSASSEPPSALRYNTGDAAAQLVQGLPHRPFTSSQGLHRTLDSRREALAQDKSREQYLVYTAVPPEVHSNITDDGSRTSKYCRFSYNETTRTLIAKVKASPEEDLAARSFDVLIGLELHSMGVDWDVDPLGSTTVTIGSWKKEADCSWGPVQFNTELNFVVIVSLSESARYLALDARAWLETPTSSVKLVVTIGINRANPEVTMQCWEIFTGSFPAARPSATIRLYRNNNTTSIAGGQLVLPFDKVVGRQPTRAIERDIVISEQILQNYAKSIWIRQGFL
ncbi:hypothetical protein Asppvi_003179 [Aspergillus pseudoviridinutans]|uniref:Uncharacterized protein n=1 Tax=Aspergillus pseudoviridinutans TaxID=1517512 RepID=A0A9P3EQW1_9EURO|nr:uncharacterized protein Asppvi_003179 [Aspergillus pseudoviridinutans]GIJ84339.1 hypothetical protein Asppvi_003179 [Aspergillus pseudoviridinutans]